MGIDIITMDEMHRRLTERDFSRRFVCFTFDDGYRDNRDFALPVMRDFGAPFTVYAASDFAEGIGRLWWLALEQVVAKAETIEADRRCGIRLDASTPASKQAAFDRLTPGCADAGRAGHAARDAACLVRPPWRSPTPHRPRPLHALGRIDAISPTIRW